MRSLFRTRLLLLAVFAMSLLVGVSAVGAQTVTPPAAYGVDTYVTGGLDMITQLNLFPIIVIAVILGIVVVVARRVRRGVI